MRTRKTLYGAIAALALLCAAGCCNTEYLYTYPDGTQVVVQKLGSSADVPPPPPQAASLAAAPGRQVVVVESRPARKVERRPAIRRSWRCNPAGETSTVAGAAATAPARKPQTGTPVLQRGRKGRIVCDEETPLFRRTAAAVPEPVVATAPVVVAEPVAVVQPEPVVVAVEEPSWAQYLAPEQTAVIAAEPYPVQPMVPAELYPVASPLYAAPAPVFQDGRQPIVIQPIIQPVVQPFGQTFPLPPGQPQFGQEVLGGQVQGLAPITAPESLYPAYPEQSSLPLPPAAPGEALLVGPQAAYYAAYPPGAYGAANPLAALYANPFGPSVVCPPGSDCFTLPENQLASGPQVIIPNAVGPAGVQGTALPAQPAVAQAAALSAPPAAGGLQDKYGALTLSTDDTARQVSRPEVSMPAPLGGTTVPPVAGTAEIENALDVMLGNSPTLK